MFGSDDLPKISLKHISPIIGKNEVSFSQKYGFSFQAEHKWWSSQKSKLKYDIFCLIGKVNIFLSCMILLFEQKVKNDLRGKYIILDCQS